MEQAAGEFQTAEGKGVEDRGLRPLVEFHGDARYGGDFHRADMAWAKHAAEYILQRKKSGTLSSVPAISHTKVAISGSVNMRKEPPIRRSGR
jgi:hypothetical protein